MPDPSDILRQLQMVATEVQRSKTGLGYSHDLMAKLGMIAFGNLGAIRDAIQAPDGQSYQAALFAEAEKRGKAEDEIKSLKDLLARAEVSVERCWSLEPGGPRKSRALSLLNAIRKLGVTPQ